MVVDPVFVLPGPPSPPNSCPTPFAYVHQCWPMPTRHVPSHSYTDNNRDAIVADAFITGMLRQENISGVIWNATGVAAVRSAALALPVRRACMHACVRACTREPPALPCRRGVAVQPCSRANPLFSLARLNSLLAAPCWQPFAGSHLLAAICLQRVTSSSLLAAVTLQRPSPRLVAPRSFFPATLPRSLRLSGAWVRIADPRQPRCLTPTVVVAAATQGGAKDVGASVDSLLQLAAVYEAVTSDHASAVGAAVAVVAALVDQEGVVDRLMPSTVTADGVFRALPVTWGIDRSVVRLPVWLSAQC